MGYTTLTNIKALLRTSTMDAADDAVLSSLIEEASAWIDRYTGRTFYARSETHKYNTPSGQVLWIDDDDLLTVTTLTNGNGTTLAPNTYTLLPVNNGRYYGIKLKSAYLWETDSGGEATAAISIAGTWGYSSATPMDIQLACELIVNALYHARYGEPSSGVATVTGAGVVITPAAMPRDAQSILSAYQRLR